MAVVRHAEQKDIEHPLYKALMARSPIFSSREAQSSRAEALIAARNMGEVDGGFCAEHLLQG